MKGRKKLKITQLASVFHSTLVSIVVVLANYLYGYTLAACTDIPDCEAILCTNSTDHICAQCRSNNGTGLGESAFANLVTECERKSVYAMEFAACY